MKPLGNMNDFERDVEIYNNIKQNENVCSLLIKRKKFLEKTKEYIDLLLNIPNMGDTESLCLIHSNLPQEFYSNNKKHKKK